MDTRAQILTDIQSLEIRLAHLQAAEHDKKLTDLSDRLASNAEQLAHELRVKAFKEYQESATYVANLSHEIEAADTVATSPISGQSTAVRLSPDQRSLTTFGQLKAGTVIEIKNRTFLIQDFQHSFGGSRATVLHLGSKAHRDGEARTPYSGFPCNFDPSSKTLITALADPLQPDQKVEIHGQAYKPIHLLSGKNCNRYELAPA